MEILLASVLYRVIWISANDESDSSGHEMDFSKTVANQGPRAKRILRNHSGKIVEDDAEYDLTDNDYMVSLT